MNLIKRYTHAAKTHKDAARMLAAAKRNGDKAGVNQAEGSDVKMHNFARSVLRLLAERL